MCLLEDNLVGMAFFACSFMIVIVFLRVFRFVVMTLVFMVMTFMFMLMTLVVVIVIMAFLFMVMTFVVVAFVRGRAVAPRQRGYGNSHNKKYLLHIY